MGKLGFGIIAVVLLQMAFGIYMTYQTGADLTAAAISTNIYVPSIRPDLVTPKNTPDLGTAEAVPETAETKPPEAYRGGRAILVSQPRTADLNKIREPRFVTRPASDDLERGVASVDRKFFGNMVVERRYSVSAKRPKRSSEVVSRQYFGNLVVERRFDLSVTQAANRPRSKKNVFLASYIPNLKTRLIVSKG